MSPKTAPDLAIRANVPAVLGYVDRTRGAALCSPRSCVGSTGSDHRRAPAPEATTNMLCFTRSASLALRQAHASAVSLSTPSD